MIEEDRNADIGFSNEFGNHVMQVAMNKECSFCRGPIDGKIHLFF